MDINIIEFDPKEATQEQWQEFHTYRRLRHEEVNPDDEFTSNELVEKSLTQDNPMARNKRFNVMKSGQIIGNISFTVLKEGTESYENNKHIAQVSASLLPEKRGKGYGYQLLAKVFELVKEENKQLIFMGTSEEAGLRFFEKIGAQIALSGAENRLNLENADWNMIRDWSEVGETRNPQTVLRFVRIIPEEDIEEFCKISTEVNNQQPLDDLDINDFVMTPEMMRQQEDKMEEMGIEVLTMYTQEPDGKISGMTQMAKLPDQKKLQQLLTGGKNNTGVEGLVNGSKQRCY